MLIYHHEVSLEEGFKILENTKENRLLHGQRVSACSGWQLFRSLRGSIRCWECGCLPDRWIADKGQNDFRGPPVLNLYGARDGQLVLMNRDHIIPKSLGGIDALENLRPACEVCNGNRGNQLTEQELQFRQANPHLVSGIRLEHGKKRAKRVVANKHLSLAVKERLLAPFCAIDEDMI